MNEIEKMYKNVGCKKILCDCTNCKKTDCTGDIDQDTCVNLTFSPFTAKKQLRLIKLLASYGKFAPTRKLLLQCLDGEWYIAVYEGMDLISNGSEVDFKKCLARVINKLWQDLTPEEKTNIKNILEI